MIAIRAVVGSKNRVQAAGEQKAQLDLAGGHAPALAWQVARRARAAVRSQGLKKELPSG